MGSMIEGGNNKSLDQKFVSMLMVMRLIFSPLHPLDSLINENKANGLTKSEKA